MARDHSSLATRSFVSLSHPKPPLAADAHSQKPPFQAFASYDGALDANTSLLHRLERGQLTFLTRSSDQGASAPGIHFHRDRNGGDHFDEVVRDMPISVILFALGIAGMLASIGLATMLGWSVMRRRRQMEGHRIDPSSLTEQRFSAAALLTHACCQMRPSFIYPLHSLHSL